MASAAEDATIEALQALFDEQQRSHSAFIARAREALLHLQPAPAAEAGVLTRLLGELAASSDQTSSLRTLGEAAQQLLPGSTGTLALLSEADRLELAALWSPEGLWLAREGRALAAEDQQRLRGAADIQLPLAAQNQPLGELRLWNPPATGWPVAEALAGAAALGLSAARLQQRLRNRSVRDPLTGLFNRRYLEDTLAREIHRGQRLGGSLGLVVLELDGFDDYAREQGRELAERMLQTVGGLLQATFRGSDCCARYAEAGFGLLLPDAALPDLRRRTEELCERIGELRIARRGVTAPGLTASAGLAGFPEHAADAEELLEAAQSALYLARQGGGQALRVAERLE